MTGAIVELKTGREMIEHAEFRAGPVNDANVYDHAIDAACLVLRKFHGIEGDGKFARFYSSEAGARMIECCKEYMRLELMLLLPAEEPKL